MKLVYFSPLPWASFAQRPHKFVEWFHRCNNESILWIDPYPTRLPNWSDIKRISQKNAPKKYVEIPPWITVIRPQALPIEPLPCFGWVNGLLQNQIIRAVDSFVESSTALLVIGKPSALALRILHRYPDFLSLYDAMDDFPEFYRGISRSALMSKEHSIIRMVNKVWASSTAIKERFLNIRSDVQLVHNAFDISTVNLGARVTKSNRTIIIGYIGTIASWFDWEWVKALAKTIPDNEIRLIGPVFGNIPKNLPSNISLHPPCDHKTAMRAMMEFDMGLIPFKNNQLTTSVDPIKYYEYRAISLPIISTDFGEMRFRHESPGVFISQAPADIRRIYEKAVSYTPQLDEQNAFISENNWDARFDAASLTQVSTL